ncbi:MAG: type II secretion system F family protein [Chloroflexi bacterium]|nr:type II secretion system F family protein [Chloroflexota bacterium]
MTTFTWIIIGIFVVLVILLIVGVLISANSERSLVEQRLGQYLQGEGVGDAQTDGSALTDWVNKRVEKSSTGDRISRQLARADLKFKVAEYFALILISSIGTGVIAWLLSGSNIGLRGGISFVAGAVIGTLFPPGYVRRQQKKRLNKFNDQLSDMLNLTVNGLRAGYSTMQAMEAVSKELPTPISDEFRRVVQEMQLGVPMDTALDNLYRRIPSDDLDFVITAINVQREVGGNLSEILDTISFTIRERVRIKGEIRVLTAQVRTSGSAMALIPIVLVGFLWFLNPEYMNSFFDKGIWCGVGALSLAGSLIISGYFVMMRIADIEV